MSFPRSEHFHCRVLAQTHSNGLHANLIPQDVEARLKKGMHFVSFGPLAQPPSLTAMTAVLWAPVVPSPMPSPQLPTRPPARADPTSALQLFSSIKKFQFSLENYWLVVAEIKIWKNHIFSDPENNIPKFPLMSTAHVAQIR